MYIFLDDWADSDEVNRSLKAWLKFHGYEITSGTLEIFPSGNALRLPLQKGFGWLDSQGELIRRREDLTEDEALASFLADADEYQSNWCEAKTRIDSQLQAARDSAGESAIAHVKALSLEGFEDLYGKGKIQEKWENGREFWQRGLFERGQRHDAVLAVGHYLWYGDIENDIPAYPGERHNGSRAQLIEAWLTEKHNGHCRHVREGHWEIVRDQIERATVWRAQRETQERPYYPVTERLLKRLTEVYKKTGKLFDIDKMAQANIRSSQDARFRIARAVRQCVDSGWQITRNGLAELAGCSKNTVSKHKDLWLLLVSGSGVYITRGGLDPFDSEGLVSISSEPDLQTPCSENEQENFSISCWLEDSRQTSGCWDWDMPESEEEQSELELRSAESFALNLCLTPYAFEDVGDGERLTASERPRVLPPSASSSLAPGSSTDFEDLRNACGINGHPPTLCAGPPHLFLGGVSLIFGLRTSQHRQASNSARTKAAGGNRTEAAAACLLFGGLRERERRLRTQKQSRAPPGS